MAKKPKIIDVTKGTVKIIKMYVDEDIANLTCNVTCKVKSDDKELLLKRGILCQTLKKTYFYKFTLTDNDTLIFDTNEQYKIELECEYKDKKRELEYKNGADIYLNIKESLL